MNNQLDTILKDRISLIDFLAQPSSKKWIKRQYFSMLQYWQQLALHKFSVCPPGNGVQSPKIAEAILSHTVPITLTLPAFVDLKKLGLPILLVHDWSLLNPSFLNKEYDKHFRDVDWSRAKRLLEPNQIMQLILTWKPVLPVNSLRRRNISKMVLKQAPPRIKNGL
jgi:hypothetical protein